MKEPFKHTYMAGPTQSLSETQRKMLASIENIWMKCAVSEPALKDTVGVTEVQTACFTVASHHIRPAIKTIRLIEYGDIPLIGEFFEELSKIPGLENKRAALEQIKAVWVEYFLPPKVNDLDEAAKVLLTSYWSIIEEAC